MKRLRSAAVNTWMRASASFSWFTVFPPQDVFVFLLDPDRKRKLSALFSLLRRDFVVRELAMGLALFVCANTASSRFGKEAAQRLPPLPLLTAIERF